MNLNCPICAELFLPSDDVHCTTCGHMFHHTCLLQWLERSKTCPQCRNKCTQKNIFKVYFNQANLDTSRIDVGSLQEQLDNANLKIKMKDMEVNKATKEVTVLKETQKKCMKTISGLEDKVAQHKHLATTYAQQMQVLRNEIKVVESLRSENKTLKGKLTLLDTVNDMVTANQEETERLLKEAKDFRALGVCITSLKKELKNADLKKTEMRNTIKTLQHQARKAVEVKKMLDEKLATLESENFHLKEKLNSKGTAKPSSASQFVPLIGSPISPIVSDSPSGSNMNQAFMTENFTDTLEEEPRRKRSKMTVLERLSNPSPGIVRLLELLSKSMLFKQVLVFFATMFITNNVFDNSSNLYLLIFLIYIYFKF
ncbi:TRAIP.2 family protein [Megaselia abdita]